MPGGVTFPFATVGSTGSISSDGPDTPVPSIQQGSQLLGPPGAFLAQRDHQVLDLLGRPSMAERADPGGQCARELVQKSHPDLICQPILTPLLAGGVTG